MIDTGILTYRQKGKTMLKPHEDFLEVAIENDFTSIYLLMPVMVLYDVFPIPIN